MLSQSDDSDGEEMPLDVDTQSFMPVPLQKDLEDTVIRSAIHAQHPLVCPAIGVNSKSYIFICTCCLILTYLVHLHLIFTVIILDTLPYTHSYVLVISHIPTR